MWAGVLLLTGTCYFLMAEVDSLSCDRDRGVCTVTHDKIYRSASQSFRVADLSGAEVAKLPTRKTGSNGGKPAVRVVILTSQGPIPLMNHGTAIGVSEMEDQATTIQRFATDPSARRLEIEHHNRVIALIAAGFALVVGGVIVMTSDRT